MLHGAALVDLGVQNREGGNANGGLEGAGATQRVCARLVTTIFHLQCALFPGQRGGF